MKVLTFPLNPPLTFGLPPSHLGIVCEQPLLSVCRRLKKGGLVLLRRRKSCYKERYLVLLLYSVCRRSLLCNTFIMFLDEGIDITP